MEDNYHGSLAVRSMLRCLINSLFLVTIWPDSLLLAAITVAASDSLELEKSRADFVCDGEADEVELLKSLTLARQEKTLVDTNPKTQHTVSAAVNHAVEWLPGTYYLASTLEIPDAVNCSISALGTTLKYLPAEGDGIVIRGMNRCRYQLGTIATNSTGVALRIQPTTRMPALMSFVDFTGLVGKDRKGVGLMLDPTHENVCVNRIVGTDVSGFDKGVFVGSAGARIAGSSTHGKCDTNWFWLSYIRLCNICVEESSHGVDCSVWDVNVDASVPDSIAIRTGGSYGKWYVIMGTYTFEKKNLAVVLEPGAQHCVFDIHPPLDNFSWKDNSQTDTNVFISTQPPGVRRWIDFSSPHE